MPMRRKPLFLLLLLQLQPMRSTAVTMLPSAPPTSHCLFHKHYNSRALCASKGRNGDSMRVSLPPFISTCATSRTAPPIPHRSSFLFGWLAGLIIFSFSCFPAREHIHGFGALGQTQSSAAKHIAKVWRNCGHRLRQRVR